MVRNTAELHAQNRRRVAQYILNHPEQTLQEIILATDMSERTVIDLLKELNRDGMVEQKRLPRSSVGRRPIAWSIKADARYSIGVRLIADALQIAALDLCCSLVAMETVELGLIEMIPEDQRQEVLQGGYRLPRQPGDYQEQLFGAIAPQVLAFLDMNGIEKERVVGVGIAMGCPISDGFWYSGKWKMNVDTEAARIRDVLGVPVRFFRDEQQAGIAEVWYLGLQDAFCLMLDHNLGGMAMQNYELWSGKHGQGASIGHTVLYPDGKQCICGKKGCFGNYCSEKALQDAGYDSIETFFAALSQGNENAKVVLETFLHDLAVGICTLTALYDVPIILSGIMVKYLRPYLPRLEEILEQQSGVDFRVHLHLGHYLERAAVVGAALQWHRWFMTEAI